MSEKFNGFSQDEIQKYSAQNNQKKIAPSASAKTSAQAFRGTHGEGIRRMTGTMTSKGILKKQQAEKVTSQTASIKAEAGAINHNVTADEMNLDQSMSRSIEEALFFQPKKKISNESASAQPAKDNGLEIIRTASSNANANNVDANDSSILHLSKNKDINSESADSSTSCIVFDDSTILPRSKNDSGFDGLNIDSPFKGISLKDFETHRKMIEEQNKQKKEMLHKAIEQYSLKTAAEARKIDEIKTELSKLDNDLALDVAILRKQIDMACLHFSNMEKQYMKIESQFLKAKIDLHNAAEKKELLTEHLCTVIAHNEDRKAQKLSELMQKVGLTSTGELEPKEILTKDTSN